MVKAPVKRRTKKEKVVKKTKKGKVVKKTKAKQIIKQKVVVNVAAPARRRRGRPRKQSEKQGPVQAGETIKEDRSTQQKFYDQQQASVPYFEEIKEDVKRLEADQSDARKALEGMYKAGIALQQQIMDRPHYEMATEETTAATVKGKRGGARPGAGRPRKTQAQQLGGAVNPSPRRTRSSQKTVAEALETQTQGLADAI